MLQQLALLKLLTINSLSFMMRLLEWPSGIPEERSKSQGGKKGTSMILCFSLKVSISCWNISATFIFAEK